MRHKGLRLNKLYVLWRQLHLNVKIITKPIQCTIVLWSLMGGLPVYLHILLEAIENIWCRLDRCPKSLINYFPSWQITLSLSHISFESVLNWLLNSIKPSKVSVESTMIWELDGVVWFYWCFHLLSHFPHQCIVVKSRKVSEISTELVERKPF